MTDTPKPDWRAMMRAKSEDRGPELSRWEQAATTALLDLDAAIAKLRQPIIVHEVPLTEDERQAIFATGPGREATWHTPPRPWPAGPWHDSYKGEIWAPGDHYLGQAHGWGAPEKTLVPVSRLWVAAPELFEELYRLRVFGDERTIAVLESALGSKLP